MYYQFLAESLMVHAKSCSGLLSSIQHTFPINFLSLVRHTFQGHALGRALGPVNFLNPSPNSGILCRARWSAAADRLREEPAAGRGHAHAAPGFRCPGAAGWGRLCQRGAAAGVLEGLQEELPGGARLVQQKAQEGDPVHAGVLLLGLGFSFHRVDVWACSASLSFWVLASASLLAARNFLRLLVSLKPILHVPNV